MSSFLQFEALKDSHLEIQKIAKTELISILVGDGNERLSASSRLSSKGEVEYNSAHNGDSASSLDSTVFAVASIFKVFIATGVALMIEELSVDPDPHNPYSDLRNGWNETFTAVYNRHCERRELARRIRSLHGDPTVRDIALHFKGAPNINHLLFAPDGSFILSEDDFLDHISQFTYTRQTEKKDASWTEYSNANYILLALLIEVISGQSLTAFLQEHIFKPLGMQHTHTTVEDLNLLPDRDRARPHMVFSDGDRRALPYDEIPYLADTVEIATLGGYMTANDIGKFFTAINKGLKGEGTGRFDKKLCDSLFRGIARFDEQNNGYMPFGLQASLNTNLLGSHSPNRLISSNLASSKAKLSYDLKNSEAIKIYYLAGSATGWASTAYFLPDKQVFVIVLTNTCGPVDSSDIISQLYLQEFLGLQPSKIDSRAYPSLPRPSKDLTEAERNRKRHVDIARLIWEENCPEYKSIELENNIEDSPVKDYPKICGRYFHEKWSQSLQIDPISSSGEGSMLQIVLHGKNKQSRPMRFVQSGQVFRICSLVRGDFTGVAIDRFGAWRNADFGYENKDGVVRCLFRKNLNGTDRFSCKFST